MDVSGISGEGVVVWGVEFPDGRCAYRWNTDTATTSVADSIDDVEAIHGHNGATRLVWLDNQTAGGLWRRYVRIGDGPPPVWRSATRTVRPEGDGGGSAG
ncbi:hypothetical protein [Actinomadura violacea]|uniref:Uncharacterized protein n=1 Tax=Actinomadura violacea TaxID=2819934 RepID=A0ABS3RY48_9ACTN|nr:hypothetical protein [Actinomadura violacea]MBO2461682.1 hypothetical protein [Actinomadura violacea]